MNSAVWVPLVVIICAIIGLCRLDLEGKSIGPAGAAAVARGVCPRLSELRRPPDLHTPRYVRSSGSASKAIHADTVTQPDPERRSGRNRSRCG